MVYGRVSLELVNRFLSKMDKGGVPLAIFIDLSTAFATLDHDILLHKLKCYGLTGKSIHFFKCQIDNNMYLMIILTQIS